MDLYTIMDYGEHTIRVVPVDSLSIVNYNSLVITFPSLHHMLCMFEVDSEDDDSYVSLLDDGYNLWFINADNRVFKCPIPEGFYGSS